MKTATLHKTQYMPPKLTPHIINAAIDGFVNQKRQIDEQIAALRAMLTGDTTTESAATPEGAPGKRKKFSAAARKRMKEAQQLRWAKIRGESKQPAQSPAPAPKPKRKLSAAARATLAANLRKARAAKAAMAKSATKKATPAPAQAPKPKRKLSAAGRAAIIAATKKMWAAKRAAAKEA